jgi:hypothetical protein
MLSYCYGYSGILLSDTHPSLLHLLTSGPGTTRKCVRARITSAYRCAAHPAQTSPLTDYRQFAMLQSSFRWT